MSFVDLHTNVSLGHTKIVGLGGEKLWLCPTLGGDKLDISGNGNHGTYNGGMGTVADTSNGGTRAYSFDGSNDYIDTTLTGIADLGSRSISAWCNFSTVSGIQYFMNWYDSVGGSDPRSLYLLIYQNTHWFGWKQNSASLRITGGTPSTGWKHYCYVHDASAGTAKIYIDGTLVASGSILNTTFGNDYAEIGRVSIPSSTVYTQFKSDDIRIFDRALSTSEIKHLASKRGVLGTPRNPVIKKRRIFYAPTAPVTTTAKAVVLKKPKPSYATGYARNASESANPNLWKGLVGAWMPSFGVTGETLRDVSGNGNNGSFDLSEATDWRTDSVGHSIEFDGADQISTSFNQSLRDFTAITWFKSSHFQSTQRIVDKNYLYGFWMGQAAGGSTTTYGGGIRQATSPYGLYLGGFATNKWHMLTMQRKGGTQLLWGNGTNMFATQSCSSTPLSTHDLIIGNSYGGERPYTGYIGNISIYNRALSPSEIKQLYVDSLAPFRTNKRTVVRVPAAIPAATKVGSIKKPTTIIKPSYQAGYARNASESENPNLWDGLVGAWMPSMGITGGTLRDVSGHGSHGTLVYTTVPYSGMIPEFAWDAGKKGTELNYDGFNDYVDTTFNPTEKIGNGNDWSVSVWINQPSAKNNARVFGNSISNRFYVATTTTTVFWGFGSQPFTATGVAIPFGQWLHAAFTYNSATSEVRSYRNGVLTAATAYTGNGVFDDLNCQIGDIASSSLPFQGKISDTSVYNRALSPSEIKQLYVDSLAPFRRKQRVSVAVPAGVQFKPYWAKQSTQVSGLLK